MNTNRSAEPPVAPTFMESTRWFVYLGITAVSVIVILYSLVRLQGVLLVVAASLVIALGVQPFIRYLIDRGLPRGWGAHSELCWNPLRPSRTTCL